MPAIIVSKKDTFDLWRQKFNQLSQYVVDFEGDINTDLVTEVNALHDKIDARPIVYFQTATPTEPTENSIWVNSNTLLMQQWNGSAWIPVVHPGWRSTITSGSNVNPIERNQFCHMTSAGRTVTLPANPTNGDKVGISVGNFTNTVINRNGNNIQGVADNLTINITNTTVVLVFVAGQGWRIE